ncbi:MAG TPA: universal stress protein [Ktedonobacterales bacterium]
MSLFSRLTHERSIHSRQGSFHATSAPDSAHSESHDTILVALSGSALDHETMTVACMMARAHRTNVVHAIYAVEVPRSLAVTDEMPSAQAEAAAALDRACNDAVPFGLHVTREYVQSRDAGECLVQLARRDDCALLVIGLPCGKESEGDSTEKVDNVLRKAPCRVWVVRDTPIAA